MKALVSGGKKVALGLLIALFLLTVVAPGANAALSRREMAERGQRLVRIIRESDNPRRTYRQFSDRQKKFVRVYLDATERKIRRRSGTSPSGIAATTTCTWVRMWVNDHNILNHKLLEYWQKIEWCFDGDRIVKYAFRTRGASLYAPLWEFIGHTDQEIQGGVGSTFYYSFTQGKFSLCISKDFACIVHRAPWLELRVNADGSYTYDGSS